MRKWIKPAFVIVLAIAAAGVVALILSRQQTNAVDSPSLSITAYPGWTRGSRNARLTLVEYGDFQCPTCAAFHPIVSQALERFPTDVKLEFHHFPLIQIHPNSMVAALAAEAAGEQGRFWEMHDMLFEHQDAWATSTNPEAEFLVYASRLSLDQDRFMKSVRSPEIQQRVLQDVTRARDLNIDAVPAFFLDGQRVRPAARVEEFENLISERLGSKR